MQRFLHVRGKPGVPVANPHSADSWRFVGLRRAVEVLDPAVHDSLIDLYEPVDEIIPDHPDLAKPIRKGELLLIGKVGAKSLEQARAHFARKPDDKPAPAPRAPKKVGE